MCVRAAVPSLSLHTSDWKTDDREFCVLPLTCDFDANPFRSHPDYGRDSQLLHHCILALSYKHINRDTGTCEAEARLHKKMALRMLKDIEGSSRWPTAAPSRESTFLDAILILMTLDVGQLPPHLFLLWAEDTLN